MLRHPHALSHALLSCCQTLLGGSSSLTLPDPTGWVLQSHAARPYWVALTCETSHALHNIALLLGVMCSQNILIYSHTLIIHCIYSDTSAHDPSHMTLHNMPLLHGVCVLRTFQFSHTLHHNYLYSCEVCFLTTFCWRGVSLLMKYEYH